jgi:serine/threonine protein phosphatase PrpC
MTATLRGSMARMGAAYATHPGRVRTHNEDSYLALSEIGLWAVADGMGGHEMGAAASCAITDALRHLVATKTPVLGRTVRMLLETVNDDLRFRAAMFGSDRLVGSTVVVLLVTGDAFTCLWAGDSRLYRLRYGVLEQMTEDHTPRRAMVEAGVLSPDRAASHSLDNLVSRAVGAHPELSLEETTGDCGPGDVFLLCSDGLTKVVDDATIADILSQADLTAAPQRLVDAALAAGAPDNITALVVARDIANSTGDPPRVQLEAPVKVKRRVAISWRWAARSVLATLALLGLFDVLVLLAMAAGAVDPAYMLALSRQVLSFSH